MPLCVNRVENALGSLTGVINVIVNFATERARANGFFGCTPGVSPMEMILIGLAGCTGMDVVSILEKEQQDVRGLQIVVRGKRAETHPRVYTEIEVEYGVRGDVDAVAVERAIALSEEKYCSVSAMLARAVKICTRYSILPVEELV